MDERPVSYLAADADHRRLVGCVKVDLTVDRVDCWEFSCLLCGLFLADLTEAQAWSLVEEHRCGV